MINNNKGDKKMKKILLSLYLVCHAIMPAYCDSSYDAESLWYMIKMFLLIISPFVVLFIFFFL